MADISTGGSGELFVPLAPDVQRNPPAPGAKAAGKRRAEIDPTEPDRPEKRRAAGQTSPEQTSGRAVFVNSEPPSDGIEGQVHGSVSAVGAPFAQTIETSPFVIRESQDQGHGNVPSEVLDLTKEHLINVNKWVEEGQEYPTLQKIFSEGIKTSMKLARPGTDLKQRPGEISTDVRAKNASYILHSYTKSWKNVLKAVRRGLEKEVAQMNDFYNQVERPATEADIKIILDNCKRRLTRFEEVDEERDSILKDLKLFQKTRR